jgi:hypothetical protein
VQHRHLGGRGERDPRLGSGPQCHRRLGSRILRRSTGLSAQQRHAMFVDVNTGQPDGPSHIALDNPDLFEPSGGPRHNLCSSDSRINGVTTIDGTNGSFHPKQQGQDAMGALAPR